MSGNIFTQHRTWYLKNHSVPREPACVLCSLFQAFAEYPESSAQLRVLLAFYASTIVSALVAAENLSDNVVAKLFPYIQKVSK